MKKVLIADDEEDVLDLLGRRLLLSGYQVIKAKSGHEAVEKARKEIPHLVILDILMQDMDGGEVARVLKEDEATKDIPIIFLSFLYGRGDEKKEGHLVGKNFFVAKPYDPNELLDIIREKIK